MNPSLAKLRVLAADDNHINLHILRVFLTKLGHEVMTAENGAQALQAFEKEQPDFILLDIMMPGMDGFEVARRIREKTVGRWVPIVYLSALDREENLVEGLEAGGDDFLTKPINFVVLEAKLRSIQRSLVLQQEAMAAYKRLQVVSDSVMEAIITTDTEAEVLACNLATELLFGWTAKELIGQNVRVIIPEPYRSRHDEQFLRYVHGGVPRTIGTEREVECLRKDGTTFPATVGITEVRMDGSRMFVGVIRDNSERKRAEQILRQNAEQLTEYYERTENEQQLAKRLMDRQLNHRGLQDPCLHYQVIAAQNFSGDVVAATRSEDGRFYVLLADATGHGLPAAISVLPILSIFYRMVALSHPVRDIILEFNQHLKESMPVGRFVAATLVSLDEGGKTGQIWVGGTPGAYLLDPQGGVLQEFPSAQLPLGIVDNSEINPAPFRFTWKPESQLLLCSDGLLEAENAAREPFGTAGLQSAIANTSPGQRFEAVQTALAGHLGQEMAADDISIVLVDCP